MKPFEVEVLEKSIEQKGNMLKGCYDDDLFKSWSGDLQKRFPNGSWKTVNGAKVFVNGGKVVAGLDGFNGEIDKFFEGRGKKESGKPHKDKNGVETYEGNVSFNALSEKDKRVAYDNGIKSGEVGGSFQEFKQAFKDEEIPEELISPDYAKESPKSEGKGQDTAKEEKGDSSKENSEKRERTKRRVELAEKMLQSIPGFSYNNRKLEEICAKDFITEGDFVMQRGDEKLYYEDDALVTKKDGKEVRRIERKNLTPEQQEEIFCLWAGKKAQTATGV